MIRSNTIETKRRTQGIAIVLIIIMLYSTTGIKGMVTYEENSVTYDKGKGGNSFTRKDALLKFINGSWREEEKGYTYAPEPLDERFVTTVATGPFISSLMLLEEYDYIYRQVAEFIDACYVEGRGYTDTADNGLDGIGFNYLGINTLHHLHSLNYTTILIREGAIDYMVGHFNTTTGSVGNSFANYHGYFGLKMTDSLDRIDLELFKQHLLQVDPYRFTKANQMGYYIVLLQELDLFESERERLDGLLDLLETSHWERYGDYFGHDSRDNLGALRVFHAFDAFDRLNTSLMIDWIISNQHRTGSFRAGGWSEGYGGAHVIESHLLCLLLLGAIDRLEEPFPFDEPVYTRRSDTNYTSLISFPSIRIVFSFLLVLVTVSFYFPHKKKE